MTPLALDEVAQYFHSRSRRSQIGAAASAQSQPLPDRSILEDAVQRFGDEHPGEIPLPDHWRGYLLGIASIEFWKDGPDRLHDRVVYRQQGTSWARTALYP